MFNLKNYLTKWSLMCIIWSSKTLCWFYCCYLIYLTRAITSEPDLFDMFFTVSGVFDMHATSTHCRQCWLCLICWCVFLAQIEFLNSVIVNLQQKNESLQTQLEAALTNQSQTNGTDTGRCVWSALFIRPCINWPKEASCPSFNWFILHQMML